MTTTAENRKELSSFYVFGARPKKFTTLLPAPMHRQRKTVSGEEGDLIPLETIECFENTFKNDITCPSFKNKGGF